jgi:hypothetical protein
MATLAGKVTLLDLALATDPKGAPAKIAEVLTKTNEILLDAPWQEANNVTGHKIARRGSLQTGTWREINSGVAIEKSGITNAVEGIGMLDSISEIDIELVRMAPNPQEFRMVQARGAIEGMSQTLATNMFYGNAALDVERFTGLAPRMGDLVTGGRVLGASGTGSDLTSAYFVQWGLSKVYMVYPKGSSHGIEHDDRGVDMVITDAGTTNTRFRAYVDYFSLKAGLVVEDYRCMGRLANIESTGTSNIFDVDKVIQLTNEMPEAGVGAAMYVNTTLKSQIEIQAKDKTNVYYGPEDAFGRPVLMLRTHPVRLSKAIVNTEVAIT